MKERDEELIADFLDGRSEAFEVLVMKYQREVFYLVKSLVFDKEEAKDITQQSFITAFSKLKRLRKRKQFRNWLLKIAVNVTRDHLRRKKTNIEFEGWMEPDFRNIPERLTIEKDMVRNVQVAISLLPVRQQEIVSLRLIHGLSFGEIAHILEIKKETARSNFHFGIKNLRKHLSRWGIDHEVR